MKESKRTTQLLEKEIKEREDLLTMIRLELKAGSPIPEARRAELSFKIDALLNGRSGETLH